MNSEKPQKSPMLLQVLTTAFVVLLLTILNWISELLLQGSAYDSWFVFHDSSWSFHEPYCSKRYIFHESYRVNREASTKLFCIDIISKHSYQRFPPLPISLLSKSFVDIFYGAEIKSWKDERINLSNIYYLIYCCARKGFLNMQYKET